MNSIFERLLAIRLNLFQPLIFMIHWVTFNCSPLDHQRFKLASYQRRLELERPATEEEKEEERHSRKTQPNWRVLLTPIVLIRMIKRYHMVGNTFFVFAFLHIILLFHLAIKSIIHTFYTGADRQRMDYFNSIYYPHIVGLFPEPYLWNNLALVLCVYSLCIRLYSLYRLVRSSIINAESYVEVRITQIDLSLMTIFETSVSEWAKFFKNFALELINFNTAFKARSSRFKFNETVLDQVDDLCRWDHMYFHNAFNFDGEYDGLLKFCHRPERRRRHANWHVVMPVRIGSSGLCFGFFASLIAAFIIPIAFVVCVFWIVSIELNSMKLNPNAGPIEIFTSYILHLLEPLPFIRVAEFTLIIFLQVPSHFDAAAVYGDATIIITRISQLSQKMAEARELYLAKALKLLIVSTTEQRLHAKTRHGQYHGPAAIATDHFMRQRATSTASRSAATTRSWRLHQQLTSESLFFQGDIRGANHRSSKAVVHQQHQHQQRGSLGVREDPELCKRLHGYTILSGIVLAEFVDLKRQHSLYVNLLIFFSSIGIAYTISLLMALKTYAELILLSVCFFSLCVPPVVILSLFAIIEQHFKGLYKTMNRLLANEASLLDKKTVDLLRVSSNQFEKKEDRSFLIAARYAITPDSAATFITYMATAILLLNRYMKFESAQP